MAFYIVKFKGNEYMNLDLARNVYKLGNTSFLLALTSGEIPSTMLFKSTFVPVDRESKKKIKESFLNVEEQDIDACLKSFKKHSGKQKESCSVKDRFFKEGEHHFVPFCDVPYSGKYNRKDRIPFIKVCANLFIVLDNVIAGKEEETILFTANKE